jgi:site-specific DNA-methyltransferase (adenine-specific)
MVSSQLICADCLVAMKDMADDSVDSIITDCPYGLEFMGKKWDYDVPSVEIWKECFRVLKPGGHLLCFGGSRTYHRVVVNIEDAQFEIRDQIQWIYSSGFPKSHNVSKGIDKAAGAEQEVIGENPNVAGRTTKGNTETDYGGFTKNNAVITAPATPEAEQWDGWGTALKPAHEPIVMARKPIEGTVAENVLEYGTGAINVDECRIDYGTDEGRYPANVIHDGSEEVVQHFPESSGGHWAKATITGYGKNYGGTQDYEGVGPKDPEKGSAARFFYCSKASQKERNAGCETNHHPTVKPVDLMRYLCRLVTPPEGIVLDPFMGSGTTGIAANLEGFNFIGIDMVEEYVGIARARIAHSGEYVITEDLTMKRIKQPSIFDWVPINE